MVWHEVFGTLAFTTHLLGGRRFYFFLCCAPDNLSALANLSNQ
jgi:hypothetical protein